MIASAEELDRLGEQIILDFHRGETKRFPQTDIDKMASHYLHLLVRYASLSDDGTLLGLTTYEQTTVNLKVDGTVQTMLLDPNMVLLERKFISQYPRAAVKERLALSRRFTLAHECAHQILFRLEPENVKNSLRGQYSQRRQYDCRTLKTKEDWNEWQANALGAAILMPRVYIAQYFEQFQKNEPLISYGGKYATRERLAIAHLTGFFGVSRRMLEIRLRQLGLLHDLPRWQYFDPCEI